MVQTWNKYRNFVFSIVGLGLGFNRIIQVQVVKRHGGEGLGLVMIFFMEKFDFFDQLQNLLFFVFLLVNFEKDQRDPLLLLFDVLKHVFFLGVDFGRPQVFQHYLNVIIRIRAKRGLGGLRVRHV